MTREEAIKWLKFDLKQWESDCKSVHPTKEALDMAIKSLQTLEPEPCEECKFSNDNTFCEVCCHNYSSMFADKFEGSDSE